MKNQEKSGFSNIILLGIVSFLNDLSSEMIIPLLPLLINSLGGSGLAIGLIGGVRDSLTSILKVLGGYLSDKFKKRKIFVTLGYFISSFFKLFLGFSKTPFQVLVFASLERSGKIREAPRDAIIADSLPKERGKGFGIHRAFDSLGAIIGSILVFVLFWYLNLDFRKLIFLAAFIAFFSLIPLLFLKEEIKTKKKFQLSFKSLSFPLKYFILISALFALANFSYMFFILKAGKFFQGKLAIGYPLFFYIIFNLFYCSFSIPFGILSDKFGRKKIIEIGYVLFSLTAFGFIFAKTFSAFLLLFLLYGLVYAIIDGNQRAFISDLSSREERATALGIFHASLGIAALPGSLIAGMLWQINPNLTFLYGSITSLIALILLSILKQI